MDQRTILLVEDADETREFLANSILKPEGYRVSTAANSQEALKLVHEHTPDLIISDYLMPEMTGLDLLQNLSDQGQKIPFILITAEGSEALAVRALRMGARDYLIKPFDIDELLDAVKHVLTDTPKARDDHPLPLRRILDHAPGTLIIVDDEKRLTYFNEAARASLKITDGTIPGTPLVDAIPFPEVIALFEQPDLHNPQEITLASDKAFNAQVSYLGSVGYIAVMQDISEIKKISQIKTDMVTAISHDLRSPLTTILGYIELLRRSGTLNEEQESHARNIVASVKASTALLSDVLELSKIESDLDSTFLPLSLDKLAESALDLLGAEINAKKQSFSLDIAPDLPRINGNGIRMKQLVTNLIQNAIKYTPEGGKIQVNLYHDNEFVVFRVKDNGIGIAAEDQPYIFDKFYRTETATDGYQGTGLGLSIVKKIVENHGGRIWVESVPKQGTTFTVMLLGTHVKAARQEG